VVTLISARDISAFIRQPLAMRVRRQRQFVRVGRQGSRNFVAQIAEDRGRVDDSLANHPEEFPAA
jgi:hypothetical protein